ncbi:MAG: MGMT family protein [Helicobacteraceae bacterium]|nr:MGMT family protein [Helicobacteraceae bacterium]
MFQEIIWKCLCKIPSGEVKTYGDTTKNYCKDFR